jgi:hypothetical protein
VQQRLALDQGGAVHNHRPISIWGSEVKSSGGTSITLICILVIRGKVQLTSLRMRTLVTCIETTYCVWKPVNDFFQHRLFGLVALRFTLVAHALDRLTDMDELLLLLVTVKMIK